MNTDELLTPEYLFSRNTSSYSEFQFIVISSICRRQQICNFLQFVTANHCNNIIITTNLTSFEAIADCLHFIAISLVFLCSLLVR